MDVTTVQRLNAINRAFYAAVADEFDQTRGQPWEGWRRIMPHTLRSGSASTAQEGRTDDVFRVLDVGCGNGRFGAFIAGEFSRPLAYHGVDNNPALLDHARDTLAQFADVQVTLDTRDIVEQPPDSGLYDLVVLFGVMHHIPGADNRLALMRHLGGRVADGGLLAFACWRFYEYERFRDRIVPFPDDLEVEPGDYLLDWRRGARALRYCHYVDDAEHGALAAASGLREIASYRADGQGGSVNRYSILRNTTGSKMREL